MSLRIHRQTGKRVLHHAAMSGDEQVVAQLVMAKVDIEACDKLVERTVHAHLPNLVVHHLVLHPFHLPSWLPYLLVVLPYHHPFLQTYLGQLPCPSIVA